MLLDGYWHIYFEKIYKTQFLPFMVYICAMLSWLVMALSGQSNDDAVSQMSYYILFGFCSIYIMNQARCEIIQCYYCETYFDYFTDYWNVNDLIYLILNILIMAMNLFDDDRTINA